MMSADKLLSKLNLLREEFLDSNHSLLSEAQEISEDSLQCLSDCFVNISNELAKCMLKIGDIANISEDAIDDMLSSSNESSLKSDDFNEIASLAEVLDSSEETKKIASILDKVLLSYAFPRSGSDEDKENFLKKIELAKKARLSSNEELNNKFVKDKISSDKEEIQKIISEKVKAYKPMEFALQTRSCPDHPGAGMTRVEENVFQCSLDKKLYDYRMGYTLLNGSKVPGGDVSSQTDIPSSTAPRSQSFSK